MTVASAPAKVILFGEHFVVHGSHALLAAINKRIRATARTTAAEKIVIRSDIGAAGEYSGRDFKVLRGGKRARALIDPIHDAARRALGSRVGDGGIEIDLCSAIPYGIGLGSSAASCVATVGAVCSLVGRRDRRWICERAVESERRIHRNSSGADCYISTFGGLIQYERREGYKKIRSRKSLSIVIGNTGIKHHTGELVAGVARFKARKPKVFADLMTRADEICLDAASALESGQLERLGFLMNENQLLLQQIRVSSKKVDDLVRACRAAGALGAKITGAGGGGSVVALVADAKQSARVAEGIRQAGCDPIEAQIDYKGLIV
ncbi:MAG TPA: mevalonate kinase [Nitrososphaera sp.]|jgi:mevalonate kinase